MTEAETFALRTLAKMMVEEKKRFISCGSLPGFFYERVRQIPPKTLSMRVIKEFGLLYNLRYDQASNGIILMVE
jgi:hypothetical protein